MPGAASDRLAGIVDIRVERVLRRPRLASAMLAESLAPALEATRLVYRKSFHDLFARVMDQAIAAAECSAFDVHTAAACMIGAFDETLIWPIAFRTGDVEATALRIEFVVGVCMNGIAPWKATLPAGSNKTAPSRKRVKTTRSSSEYVVRI